MCRVSQNVKFRLIQFILLHCLPRLEESQTSFQGYQFQFSTHLPNKKKVDIRQIKMRQVNKKEMQTYVVLLIKLKILK